MGDTLNIVGAFILGGIIPFGTIGGIAGYYWARGDVRRAVFEWLHKNWPEDYHSVCEQVFEDSLPTELH